MSDDEARDAFRMIRWADTNGEPSALVAVASASMPTRRRKIFKCKACEHQFSVTSGTIFASRKLPVATYPLGDRDLRQRRQGPFRAATQPRSGRPIQDGFRPLPQAPRSPRGRNQDETVSGEVEIDGAYFGGYVKPSNYKENRRDRRLANNQNGKRRVVVIARETERQDPSFRVQERRPLRSNDRAQSSSRAARFTPTKRRIGTRCTTAF